MKIGRIIFFGLALLVIRVTLGELGPSGPRSGGDIRAKLSLARLPLSFEENRGQAPGTVDFLARGQGYALFLEPSGAVMRLAGPAGASSTLKIKLEGADPSAPMAAEDMLSGVSNYFIGSDPAAWRTGIPHYAKVRTLDVYPGIDLVYYGNQRELEFDLVVEPGADPSRIVLALDGAEKLAIDRQGDLLADIGDGQVRLRRPLVYQGSKVDPAVIDGAFRLIGPDRVGFEVSSYDADRPLVIDPSIAYSTYFGSGDWEMISKVAVDQTGCLFIQGSTQSTRFPVANALYPTPPGGLFDVFVSKISAAGDTLLFSTYFGGSGRDTGSGIAVDADGDVYMTGDTDSSNFPKASALQPTFGGSGSVGFGDAFLTKMKGDGTALIYSTYLGGSRDDLAMGIAVDASENAYVMGVTESTNFPRFAAYQNSYGGGGLDMFLSKVNPDGSAFIYSTFLGGSGTETSYGFGEGDIAVTADGYACIVGYTNSTNFPLANAYQAVYGGSGEYNIGDAFVTKYDPTGQSLVFSTYLGGADNDYGNAVAMDASGNVYMTGKTLSQNFPTKNAYQAVFGGDRDIFISAFNSDGTALLYSTYLGGPLYDSPSDITANALGNAYIVGGTSWANFPTVEPIQATISGGSDVFITVFAADGMSLAFSTFLGGTGEDGASSIRLDAEGNIYIAGGAGPGFPMVNALRPNPPLIDGGFFMAKIEGVTIVPGPTLTTLVPSSADAGDAGFSLAVLGSDFVDGAVVRWDGSNRTTTFISGSEVDAAIDTADLAAGKLVMVTVRNPDTGVSNSLPFTINNPLPVLTSISPTSATGGGAAFTLTVEGTDFVPNSVVRWNGSSRTTTYISGTELQAAILASDLSTGGDIPVTVFNPAPSGGVSSAIVFPVSTYAMSSTPTSATVTAGGSATFTIQLAPQSGSFDSAVSFSCVGLPSKCTPTFAPASVTPGAGPVTTTLTLATQASSAGVALLGVADFGPPAVALVAVLSLLLWAGLTRRIPWKLTRRLAAACAVVCLAILIGSCSSGGGDDNPPPYTGTPKGTYQVTVRGTSGTMTVSTIVTFTVQ